MLITLLIFLLLLSVLVLIHEAGHYFVAKWFGIKVEEFGYGFPPRAWGKKIGETIYSINWLPIGGFVKLYGEDDAGGGKLSLPTKSEKLKAKSSDLDRAFFARPVYQRALVVVAGVVMNALLAVIIYYAFMFLSGFKTELPLIGNHHFIGVEQQKKSAIIVTQVSKDSPAGIAGITTGSKIISINKTIVDNAKTFSAIIKQYKGKEITLETKDLKTNKTRIVQVTPRINPPKNEGSLGIGYFSMATVVLDYQTPVQKVFSGIMHPVNLMAYNFDVMGQLLLLSFKERNAAPISEGVSGPVGIFSLVGSILQIPDVKEKILQVLNLAGILSISLAFFNILPIPALDGGRLFFILLEGVIGKKVNQRVEAMIHTVGMVVLLGLILLVTFKDVLQLFR